MWDHADAHNSTAEPYIFSTLPESPGIHTPDTGADNGENTAFIVTKLKPWGERKSKKLSINNITAQVNAITAKTTEAKSFTSQPPAISGMSMFGGFEYQLLDKGDRTPEQLFEEGKIVAQDASSIKVAEVTSPKEGMYILDACSAPGAKSMHLASIMNNKGKIISCDVHEHKLKLIEENARKLGVSIIETKLSDGTKATYQEEFDIIVLDVPCSGLGVINHKSDLKYKMTIDKIKSINEIQNNIIENLCIYIKKNGFLVYSTCTINKDENERLINKFLKKHSEFVKREEHIIVQNFNTDMDGFYIAKLERI